MKKRKGLSIISDVFPEKIVNAHRYDYPPGSFIVFTERHIYMLSPGDKKWKRVKFQINAASS